MRPNPSSPKSAAKPTKKPAEAVVKDIRRATRRHFSAEDKIRIVLEGLRGEESIAELCRREGIAQGSVAKIVKLEHAWRRLDGRNDDGFQVAPFPG